MKKKNKILLKIEQLENKIIQSENIDNPRIFHLIFSKFCSYILKIKNTILQNGILNILSDYQYFCICPAAIRHHHNFRYGLLVHSIEVVDFAIMMYKHTQFIDQNLMDLLIFSAMIHDLGKINNYNISNTDIISYKNTQDSHSQDCIEILKKYSLDVNIIVGIISSHMGKIEWGALRVPETDLEKIVHHADMASAHTTIRKCHVDYLGYIQKP